MQYEIAEVRIKLEPSTGTSAGVTQDLSTGVDHGMRWPPRLIAAKYFAVTNAWSVVETALGLTGGAGIPKRNGMEMVFRDARLGRVHASSSALTHEVVAKSRSDRPRLPAPLGLGPTGDRHARRIDHLHPAATGAALAGPFAQFAEIIRDVPGFASKVWLRDGDMRGGFYLFADEAAARAYVERAGRGRGPGDPVFADVHVRSFEVDTDLSARTGICAHTSPPRLSAAGIGSTRTCAVDTTNSASVPSPAASSRRASPNSPLHMNCASIARRLLARPPRNGPFSLAG